MEQEQQEVICPNCGITESELDNENLYWFGSCFEYVCPKCKCNFIESGLTLDNNELFHNL